MGKMAVERTARMGCVNCIFLSATINKMDSKLKKMSLVKGANPTLKKGGGERSMESSAMDCAEIIHW
jgi:hypothetical protein